MIPDILFLIIATVFNAIAYVLSFIPNPLPVSAFGFIGYALGFLNYFSGVWDIPTLLTQMGVMLSFMSGWIVFLIVNWIVSKARGTSHH